MSVGRPSVTAHHLTSTSELTPTRTPTNVISVEEPSARGPPWWGMRGRTLERNHITVTNVGKHSVRVLPLSHTRKLTLVKKPIKSLTVGKRCIRAPTLLHFRACLLSCKILFSTLPHEYVRLCSSDVLLEKKRLMPHSWRKALRSRSEKGPFSGGSCPTSATLLEKISKWEH